MVDREYVLAGFTGLLLANRPTEAFAVKYALTASEKRRCSCTVIQQIMQGGNDHEGQAAVRLVEDIGRRFGIGSDDRMRLAWEVLRGGITTVEKGEDNADILCHVLRYFLRDAIPNGPIFGYTGMADSFTPRDTSHPSEVCVADLVYQDLDRSCRFADLPSELQELFRDVGLVEDGE